MAWTCFGNEKHKILKKALNMKVKEKCLRGRPVSRLEQQVMKCVRLQDRTP
jgi:hypothetical protein